MPTVTQDILISGGLTAYLKEKADFSAQVRESIKENL